MDLLSGIGCPETFALLLSVMVRNLVLLMKNPKNVSVCGVSKSCGRAVFKLFRMGQNICIDRHTEPTTWTVSHRVQLSPTTSQ